MNILDYKQLIKNLPVNQQALTTKRITWQKAEENNEWLKIINNELFENNDSLTLSRQDIFNTNEIRKIIIKTIYWGYTRGMRGNNFQNILNNIDLLEKTLIELKSKSENEKIESIDLIIFKKIKGLGLSTYSKLLYFLNINFNNLPCLILDQRLIDVFSSRKFIQFNKLNNISNYNAERKYLDFLVVTNHIANEIQTENENIEQFLFIFGNNLKNKIDE